MTEPLTPEEREAYAADLRALDAVMPAILGDGSRTTTIDVRQLDRMHRAARAAGVTLDPRPAPTPPDALDVRLDTIRSAVAAMIDPKSESYDRLTRNGAFRDVLDLIDAAKP